MTKTSIEITRDWAMSRTTTSKTIKVTTYTDGVANEEKMYRV